MNADCGITEIAEAFTAARVEAASGDGAILFACTAHAGADQFAFVDRGRIVAT